MTAESGRTDSSGADRGAAGGLVSTRHPADALDRAVAEHRAPVCVGLDPVYERIPTAIRGEAAPSTASPAAAVEAVETFSGHIIDAVAGTVPCVKVQSACFERYGAAGVAALGRTLARATQAGLIVIDDAKRGDIGISAEHYAAGVFGQSDMGGFAADWVTASAYLGVDGLTPFLARGGAFALVRTSNPGGDAVQAERLEDGRTVAEAVADLVAACGSAYIGRCGYSALGAVVGATKRDELARLRQRMPEQIFLVPGYGAQGGGVEDVLSCFHDGGRGAVVTASRSVIYAFEPGDAQWLDAVRRAADAFADEIGRAVGLRSRR